MAKTRSIVKSAGAQAFEPRKQQEKQFAETGSVQYGASAPAAGATYAPQEPKKSSLSSIVSHAVDSARDKTFGTMPLPIATVNVDASGNKSNAQSDYEDARRRLWVYQNDPQAQAAAKEKEKAYNQALQEGATGTGAVYQDETLSRLQREAKKAEQVYESEKTAAHDQNIYNQDMADISAMSDAERKTLASYGNYLRIQRQDASSEMGPEPGEGYPLPREYQALVDKYGESRLAGLAETATREAQLQQRQAVQDAAKRTSDGTVGGIASSIVSIPANLAGGAMALAGRLDEAKNATGRYQSLSPYTYGDALNTYTDTVRQNVAGQIAGDGSNFLRTGASILYQVGMGVADSTAKAIVLGPAVGAATSAMGSYTRTLADATERGATAAQANLLASSTAALDFAMDKIPLDRLFSLASSGSTSALKAALSQAGIEMTTEGASFLGSQLLEMSILQQNSQYAQSIQAYRAQGLSPDDAVLAANKDLLSQAGQQLLVAGLSGGISAGVSTAIGNHRAKNAPQESPIPPEQTPLSDASARETLQPSAESPETQAARQQPEADAAQKQKPVQNQTEPSGTPDFVDEFADWGKNPARDGVKDPMADRPYSEAGKRSTKAYMYEHPEAKRFFQEQALWLLNELQDTTKGERNYNADTYYQSGGQAGFTGTSRHTSDSIAELLDQDGLTYDQISKGLNAILTDNGAENNAASKRIEYVINKRLMDGYTDFYTGERVPGNEDYLNMLRASQAQQPAQEPTQQQPPDPLETVSRMAQENAQAREQQQQQSRQSVQDQVEHMTGGEPSVGAADRNFTGSARYQDMLSDDNVKAPRKTDVRPDETPETDTFTGQRISDVAANLMGSKNTTDAAADQVKELISSGVFSYDKKTNEQSLKEAYADLNARGTDAVRADILRHLAHDTIEDGDIAKAVTLTNQYIQSGDETAAAEMMSDLSLLAQKSGRNLQLFSLIRRMTPEGQLDVIQSTADKMLARGKQPKAKKGEIPQTVKADIPVQLKNNYLEAARTKDSAKIQAATNAIAASVGSQYKASFREKWDAWRYMCMLGNASTNVRNVAGNILMEPYAAVKDKMAAAFEGAAQKAGLLKKEDRTKAIHTDRDLLAWAKEDTKSIDAQNALKYSAKVGADVTQDIMSENIRVFKTGALEKARKAAEWAPRAGDMIFKNGYYARYLANFLTARGVSRADIEAGKVDANLLSQARQYAVDNAYVNTFNDSNHFSDAIASVGKWKASSNPVTRAFGTAIDGVLPFRRTPANILVRFKEYSPVEFVTAGVQLHQGKITASDFCNSLATGLTGSAAMALGGALAHGIFNDSGDGVRLITKTTDEEKLQGKQDYSVEVTVNGKTTSFTVDWAAPAILPLFVGVNLVSATKKTAQEDGDFADALINFTSAAKDTLEPMLALSCLSSINDLLENIKYSEDGSYIYKIAASAATSYLTQGIPSLLRQTATFAQTNKQTTFANDERKPVRDVQRTLSNIPFVGSALGLKTDKLDVWGQKISTGSVGKRAFDAYLNPSKVSSVSSDAVTRELSRLSGTEYGTGVTPELAPKTLTYTDNRGVTHKDVRLTAQQWESYASTKGQTSKKILGKLVLSSDYQKLTDAGKAAAAKLVYQYADKVGAVKAMSDSDGLPETWMEEAQSSGSPGTYIVQKVNNQQMKTAMDQLTAAWSHGSSRPASQTALENAYTSFSKSSDATRQAIVDAAEGSVKTYLEARTQGLPSSTALSVLRQVQSVPKEDRNKAAYQYQAVASTKGLSDAQMDKAMKLYMPDYDPKEKEPVKTEPRYDYIRQKLGFSPKEYAAAAYAMRSEEADTDGNGRIKKNEAIQAIMDLGYDQQTATWFWGIYSGNGSNAYKNALNRFISENY